MRLLVGLCGGLLLSPGLFAATVISQDVRTLGEGAISHAWSILNEDSASETREILLEDHVIQAVPDFENPAVFNGADAAWVNSQYYFGGALSTAAVTNLTNFVSAGHKTVIVTDNSNWTWFNNGIEQITGGSITDTCDSSSGTPVAAHLLTTGITSISNSCGSILDPADNLDMLFSNGMAGLYQVGLGQVLVVTTVELTNTNDNAMYQFNENISEWLTVPVAAVPVPAAVWLFGSALAGLGWLRRKPSV